MAAIKSAAEISEKWTRVTPGRQSDYENGVRNPTEDWASKTSGAEGAWSAGVQDAITNKRFARGIREAGTEKWQRKTTEVGIGRWGAGVRAAGDDYQAGFDPYRQVISSVSLPARYPKGDPRNFDRVAAVANALHKKKVQG